MAMIMIKFIQHQYLFTFLSMQQLLHYLFHFFQLQFISPTPTPTPPILLFFVFHGQIHRSLNYQNFYHLNNPPQSFQIRTKFCTFLIVNLNESEVQRFQAKATQLNQVCFCFFPTKFLILNFSPNFSTTPEPIHYVDATRLRRKNWFFC